MSAFKPTHRRTTDHLSVCLPHKASSAIAYTYRPPTRPPPPTSPPKLLVFLNGLALPQSGWQPVITLLCGERETVQEGLHDPPPYGRERGFGIMTYDRFGQGETEAVDPADETAGRDAGFGHDLNEVVEDLDALVRIIPSVAAAGDAPSPIITFCANSIGCAIARHYAALHPGTVAGLILLDPIMSESNFTTDVFPPPTSPGFSLPKGVTLEVYDQQREEYARRFAPTRPNKESFDRRNMRIILPSASTPTLLGPDDQPPVLRIVAHDAETFAEDSLRDLGAPLSLTLAFPHAAMSAHNTALLEICPGRNGPSGAKEGERQGKVIIAKGCGHFVQRDGPGLVSSVIEEVLRVVGW